jgi:hypothetical protein
MAFALQAVGELSLTLNPILDSLTSLFDPATDIAHKPGGCINLSHDRSRLGRNS